MPLIVGAPRSGTTLLRLMLDAHPDLAIPPQTHFLAPVAKLSNDDAQLREAVWEAITRASSWPDLGLTVEQYREAFDAIEPFTRADACRAVYRLYASRFGKCRWGDKTTQYLTEIDHIAALLPEARVIHIIRDGRDVMLSQRRMNAPEEFAARVQRWVEEVRTGRRLGQSLPHYTEVRYEDLLADPRRELIRLCRFIELPFNESMLRYHETARARLDELQDFYLADGSLLMSRARRLEVHELTSKPPDRSRTGCWRKEMTADEQDQFHSLAGEFLREVGYEVGR